MTFTDDGLQYIRTENNGHRIHDVFRNPNAQNGQVYMKLRPPPLPERKQTAPKEIQIGTFWREFEAALPYLGRDLRPMAFKTVRAGGFYRDYRIEGVPGVFSQLVHGTLKVLEEAEKQEASAAELAKVA